MLKKYYIKRINDKKIAFVNFCENEWSIATQTTGGSAPLNPIKNYYQIQEAKKKSDYVIVIIHGGREHYQLPTPRMKETYRFFIDAGADVIVNHHQHCYSGYEIYNSKPIFYGLGNFCFDANGTCKSYWQEGYIIKLNLGDYISFDLLPYEQCGELAKITFIRDATIFYNKIQELNNIILDEKLLYICFMKRCKLERKSYLCYIEPILLNKYLSFLYRKSIIPSLWTIYKKNVLLNVIRCESHRDILIKILNKNFNTRK